MSKNNISFILHKPQLSENIGACARAMKNFDFKKLILIDPKPIFPNDKILATSVGAKNIIKQSKKYDNLEKIVMTEEQTEKYKLYNQVYIKYICEKSDSQLIVEQKEDLKKQNLNLSKNTKTIRYTCSFSAIPSEKSKILIDGPKAYETTAIGVDIIYSNVNLTDKGAFTLQGASNDPGRAWFIGSQSFLLLDTDMLPYNCN